MTKLQRKALTTYPLSKETVESFYDGSHSGTEKQCLRALCESHERLRAEVEGAEILLSEDACNQCGKKRQDWQDPQDNRCPMHAAPEPYSSCDGTLQPRSADHPAKTYYEQKPKVTTVPGHAEPIRVSFSDVVLALDPVEASWLSANVGRAIRDMDREEQAKSKPITVAEKRTLKVGARVLVRDDGGYEAIYDVRTEPWQLGSGHWVIGLKGISGGYSLDRVIGVLPTNVERTGR